MDDCDASREDDFRHTITTKMHIFDLRLSRTEQEQSNMTAIMTKLMHFAWGNGAPGADKRIDRLERSEAAERAHTDDGRESKMLLYTLLTALASLGATILMGVAMLLKG